MPIIPFEYLSALGVLLASWLLTLAYLKFHPQAAISPKEFRRMVTDKVFNLFLTFVLGWKLSPLFFQFGTVAVQPSALLYLPGGMPGVGLGVLFSLGYGFLVLKDPWKRIPDGAGNPFRRAFLVGGLSLVMWGSLTMLVYPALKANPATAPDFTLEQSDGKSVHLAELQGKPVILNFWASWCPPCRAEFPELEVFAQKWKDKAVLLSINASSTEKSDEDSRSFLSGQKVSYPVVYDHDGAVQKLYGVTSLPTTLVLDSQGRILERKVGAVTEALLSGILEKTGKRSD